MVHSREGISQNLNILTGLLIVQYRLKGHRKEIGVETNSCCRYCEEKDDVSHHRTASNHELKAMAHITLTDIPKLLGILKLAEVF